MVHITDNYYLDSDGIRNYILLKKAIVGEGKHTHKKADPENIGKETFYPLGYYSSFGSVIRSLMEKKLIEELPRLSGSSISDYFKKQDELFNSLSILAADLISTLHDGRETEENA